MCLNRIPKKERYRTNYINVDKLEFKQIQQREDFETDCNTNLSMAFVKCLAFLLVTLLGFSTYGNGKPLPTEEPIHSTKTDVAISKGCALKNKTFWTENVNWTRLRSFPKMIAPIHNNNFNISYCSGRCIEHDRKTGGHVINDSYALQMRNLVKACENKGMNCEELSPCCVPKRYHGHNNPVKIEFTKIPVDVEYIDQDGHVRSFTHIFLSPQVCHCN